MPALNLLGGACLSVIALAGFANATCNTFKPTGGHLATPGDPALRSFKRAAQISQRKQATPGIACGRPELTSQRYGPWGGPAERASVSPGSCHADQCYIAPKGNVFYSAQTNLTAIPDPRAPDASDTPSARIIDLAIAQVPKFQQHGQYGLKGVRVGTSDVTNLAGYCLAQGQSGWVIIEPRMLCIEGVLQDCDDDGSKLEQDGVGVSVCVPQFDESSEVPQVDTQGVYFHTTTVKEAAGASKNPATQPFPELPGAAAHSADAKALGRTAALSAMLVVMLVL